MRRSTRFHPSEVVMVSRGSALTMALLVLISACAPADAAPRARKPKRGSTTPFVLAQTTEQPAAKPQVEAPAPAAAPAASSSSATTAALTAPAPEEVRGAIALDQTGTSTPVRVNDHGEKIPDVLRLYPNESKIIKVEGLKRVSITNQNIADVVIVSPDEILVLPNQGGAGGRTSAYFWDKDGRKEIRIVVIGRAEESSIAEQIQRDINLADVSVEYINNRIILRGKVRNGAEKRYATDISGLYGGPILNLLEVEGVSVDPKEALIKLLNLPDVKITVVNTALQASAAQLAPAPGQASTAAAAQPQQSGISVTPPLYVSANTPPSSSASSVAGGQTAGSAANQAPSQSSPAGIPAAAPPQTVMVLLEGTVDDEQDKARADEITRAFFNGANQNSTFGNFAIVINHIEVVKPVQVLVEGMLLDINTDNSKQFDFKWGTNQITGIQPGQEVPSPPAALPVANQNSINFMETPIANTLGQFTHTGGEVSRNGFWPPFPFPMQRFNRMDPLLVQVSWAIKNNKAKLIASPKVVTRSGLAATINVGGTVPLPVPAGLGVTGIQLLRFGTQMRITPTVDHRGNIDTIVNISVSDAKPGGESTNRDTETRVTVRDGQHIVVSGLVQNTTQLQVTKVPFFGDLPWVGRLFQTKTNSEVQRETVAIITPRLLDAVEKEEMFASRTPYGEVGPSAADLKAANKGAKNASRASGAQGSKPAPGSSESAGNSAIERARLETQARIAKLTTSSGTLEPSSSAPVTERQQRVRAMFEKMRQQEKAASTRPVAVARAAAPRNVTAPETELPLMTLAPTPLAIQAEASKSRLPAWGDDLGGDGAPSPFSAPGSSRDRTLPADGKIATVTMEEVRAATSGASSTGEKDDSIEQVSRKIDDLFDRIDRNMTGQAQ
ncbi:MAG: pilus assembly protein N-terminal domain-containing protein [Candidatus Wallbacteria bacterium]|nr:pilus assembly protein N-terminal domain-containing protein [Candidatus Wallbacteria bacterium]